MSRVSSYQATKEDLQAIEEALNFVWHPKMRFIFRERKRITKTVVVSYDSNFIYLWKLKSLGKYHVYKIPHNLKLQHRWQYAWCASIWDKKIENLLPESIKKATRFEIPRISGGLLTPFIELQKRVKGETNNPYTTRASYLATIIHEFGHVYWNSYKLWWPSNKKENLQYLKLAKKLYGQAIKLPKISLNFSTLNAFGEIFAFCTEYYASNIFWPKHKKILDTFEKKWLTKLIKEEVKKDLERENSTLEPTKDPHTFASVFGKIIINKHPKSWPKILTNPHLKSFNV